MYYDMIPPGSIRDKKSKAIVFRYNEHIQKLKNEINSLKLQLNKYEKSFITFNKRLDEIEKRRNTR